ncbi:MULTISPECIES: preprotein translocase subunit SecA [Nitrosomonas]|uniref:Protein translocase subunit SecA n=1 Tax=Nitrosomonas europaea (strain ATCC 19718 / CIP 103999 / KCTC 2705 / NBRC 14298) TaxID=228410 RepID=SECA_NITEU|nr:MULTISPECIES: preprotein translocase subunit SecA [Nitrosomonas]Q82W86.1 RecName: Full=Protein translocase subunit SecA [Nitrosomonas europaea ATCC 19718]KXK46006.1 MAG: preprotein translocase subunit SecA [Nitrosomonas europaea]MEB2331357.1 preprotein translocase subunit SecA [Nitrosomonas sp.]CAD84719.1 SecA protein:SEC-C motif [Nitrosomonas europaea ATCC 19718]SDW33699.1 protein translocase subunit secA [Nitrosomonas europaea]SES92397.1 protein translocase subunit secA [Nitrosomonas eur
MLSNLLKSIFGSRNDRLIKQYLKIVRTINELEAAISPLSDEELRAKTSEFKQRVANGEKLDQLLPEAFAVVREAGKRVLGMRHFDVQLIGGMVLHEGKIAEMRTGEGKTLMATLPTYLNALSGKGVHIVTVNDYLAKRDAEWMGQIYRFLGLTVGVVLSQMPHEEKQAAYAADITYGTNNEYGFDYLRDNMVGHSAERVQRVLNFAIVDEVDSILIDEARTPLIISGMAEGDTEIYKRIDTLIPGLTRQEDEKSPGDYSVDEKTQQVLLSEEGFEHAEKLLSEAGLLSAGSSLYDPMNVSLIHHLNAALRARALYNRDQHYVVQNGEVIIVDEFTGRLMPGRRWSEGLHQAVEAKENVPIQKENQTLASITFQNYFRMYEKLAGMTGTADTEAFEFQQIYGLETVVIPTHRPMTREDRMDQVFRTPQEKYQAIIADIKDCYERKQPVLVGTTSIENNELLAALLTKEKLPHQVLNAKQHAREADIIAQAGQPKMVTIATNMAGRGTDIVLGGNPEQEINRIRADETLDEAAKSKKIEEIHQAWQARHDEVIKLGGLHIIGTERHESRRIDNQLRGRAGRQGDPGSSRFYLSLEDPLLRIFSSDRVANIMTRLKMPEGEAIEHPWVTRAIENAQRKVEARNFDIRKQLLEYDDVANDQRKVIYQQRNELLDAEQGVSETISAIRESVVHQLIDRYIPEQSIEEQWDIPGLEKALASEFHLQIPLQKWLEEDSELHEENLHDRIIELVDTSYLNKVEQVGAPIMHQYERMIMLHSIDTHWREHLAALDHLRQGIHLRGYAQQNPKQEYKREAFELFTSMLDAIKADVTKILMTVQIRSEQQVESVAETSALRNLEYHHDTHSELAEEQPPVAENRENKQQPFVRKNEKVGRNDPCPCGSGKKYKQCHGKLN